MQMVSELVMQQLRRKVVQAKGLAAGAGAARRAGRQGQAAPRAGQKGQAAEKAGSQDHAATRVGDGRVPGIHLVAPGIHLVELDIHPTSLIFIKLM